MCCSPATFRLRRPQPWACSPGPPRSRPRPSTSRTSRGCCTCPPASCAPSSANVTRVGGTSGRTRRGCSEPRVPPAAGSRSSSTSRYRTARPTCRPACTGTTRRITPSCGIGPPPRGDAPIIVVTGVPWRTGWRYRERGFRHVYWDAGTMLAQLLAVADSAGHATRLHTRFPDAAVAALVGADRVHEWPVAVVALGDGTPALEATGDAVAGEVDVAPVEFPLVTDAQRAGELAALRPAVGSGRARRRSGRGKRSDRDGRVGSRFPATDGPEPRPAGAHAADVDARRDARNRRTTLRRRPRRRRARARRLPLAGLCRSRFARACCARSSTGWRWSRGSRATRRSS